MAHIRTHDLGDHCDLYGGVESAMLAALHGPAWGLLHDHSGSHWAARTPCQSGERGPVASACVCKPVSLLGVACHLPLSHLGAEAAKLRVSAALPAQCSGTHVPQFQGTSAGVREQGTGGPGSTSALLASDWGEPAPTVCFPTIGSWLCQGPGGRVWEATLLLLAEDQAATWWPLRTLLNTRVLPSSTPGGGGVEGLAGLVPGLLGLRSEACQLSLQCQHHMRLCQASNLTHAPPQARWHHGHLSVKEAEKLLMEGEGCQGSVLVQGLRAALGSLCPQC